MGDILRRRSEDQEALADSLSNRTAQNPRWREISLPFSELKVEGEIYQYRQNLQTSTTANFNSSNVNFNVENVSNFISTRDDALIMSFAPPVFSGGRTDSTAFIPGFPLMVMKRIRFGIGAETLTDVSPRGLYMMGCLTDRITRERLFSHWHIGDSLADRHAMVVAGIQTMAPLFHVAPFFRPEMFLKCRDLIDRVTYTLDFDTPQRILSLDGAVLTGASFTSPLVVGNQPVLQKRDEEMAYQSRTQEMYLDTYATQEFTIPPGVTSYSASLSFNTNFTGMLLMVTNEVAEGEDYRPFTGVPLTKFHLNLEGRTYPNTPDDPVEYSQFVFGNCMADSGYEQLPPNVYGMNFGFRESPDHDISLSVLHVGNLRTPTLNLTMSAAGLGERRLTVLYMNKRFGVVDATRRFSTRTVQ